MPLLASPEKAPTRDTQKRIVRYIHRTGLSAGSRIEVNASLLRELRVSDRKLQRAMKGMVEAGVLIRRRRLGTVVRDPNAAVPQLWKVAVAVNMQSGSGQLPFEAVLSERMRVELALHQCSEVTYVQLPEHQAPSEARQNRWLRFPGLREAVGSGQVDAVLTPCRLDGDATHLACHVGTWEDASWGVVIDDVTFIETAYRALRQQAGQRFALVRYSMPSSGRRRGADRFLQLLQSDNVQSTQPPILSADNDVHNGALLGERLLALPPQQRPDSLIIQDDLVAASLLCRVAQSPSYRPRVAVQVNAQLSQIYPLPVTRVAIDVCELARMGIETLLDGLRNPNHICRLRRYYPYLEEKEN